MSEIHARYSKGPEQIYRDVERGLLHAYRLKGRLSPVYSTAELDALYSLSEEKATYPRWRDRAREAFSPQMPFSFAS